LTESKIIQLKIARNHTVQENQKIKKEERRKVKKDKKLRANEDLGEGKDVEVRRKNRGRGKSS